VNYIGKIVKSSHLRSPLLNQPSSLRKIFSFILAVCIGFAWGYLYHARSMSNYLEQRAVAAIPVDKTKTVAIQKAVAVPKSESLPLEAPWMLVEGGTLEKNADGYVFKETRTDGRHRLHSNGRKCSPGVQAITVLIRPRERQFVSIELRDADARCYGQTTFGLNQLRAYPSPGVTKPFIDTLADGWYRLGFLLRVATPPVFFTIGGRDNAMRSEYIGDSGAEWTLGEITLRPEHP